MKPKNEDNSQAACQSSMLGLVSPPPFLQFQFFNLWYSREAKVRCNGKQPCSKVRPHASFILDWVILILEHQCSASNLTCSYRPSQRGGIRRRPRRDSQSFATPLSSFQAEPQSRSVDHALQQASSPAERSSVIYNSENVINLLAPFRGLHNLNVTSNTTGADVLPLDSGNGKASNVYESSVRTYASNDDM